MQAVFIVINEPDQLQDVLTALLEVGITRATIVESQGMGRAVMDRLSIFAGFRDIWTGNLGYGYTLFAIVDDFQMDDLIASVKDIMADSPSESNGVLFSVPVTNFINLNE